MNLKSETLKKLKCSSCDCYLSRIPIYVTEEGKGICGRCPKPEIPSLRMIPYENLIREVSFPCMNQIEGCTKTLHFSELQSHEENCDFRNYICPVMPIGTCEWVGSRRDMYQHCMNRHPTQVLKHPCVLQHNMKKNSERTFLLFAGGLPFLVLTKICVKSQELYHCVRLVSRVKEVNDLKFKLTIERKGEKLIKNGKVHPLGCITIKKHLSVICRINSLIDVLGGISDAHFTINILQDFSTVNIPTFKGKDCLNCKFHYTCPRCKLSKALQYLDSEIDV